MPVVLSAGALVGGALFISGLLHFLEANTRADVLRDLSEPY